MRRTAVDACVFEARGVGRDVTLVAKYDIVVVELAVQRRAVELEMMVYTNKSAVCVSMSTGAENQPSCVDVDRGRTRVPSQAALKLSEGKPGEG